MVAYTSELSSRTTPSARHAYRFPSPSPVTSATCSRCVALFEQWLQKSRADLALLTTVLPSGPFPYAGVPWFSTAFGRDAIITSLQTLWIDPSLSRGVLAFLAGTQARETSHFQASAPGKIM